MDDREGFDDIAPEREPVRVADAPAPPSSGRQPLRRSVRDRVLGGVAGGLAERFGVSTLAVRIPFGAAGLVVAFLLLRPWTGLPPGISSVTYMPEFQLLRSLVTFAAGLGVLGYGALWVLVPQEGAETSSAGRVRGRLPRATGVKTWLGTLALIAGATVLGAELRMWSVDVVWAFLLIGVGVLLFRRDAERANGGTRPTSSVREPTTATVAAEPLEREMVPMRAPRERSPLGWLVVGIALLVVGIAAVAQNLGGLDLRMVRFPALGLLVLGIGLLVGAFVGRARWLVLPAMLAVPIVLAFSVVAVPLEGGIGDISARPTSIDHIPGGFGETSDGYRAIAGSVWIDMTAFRCETGSVWVNASTGFGTVGLNVPFDAHVRATGSAGFGQVSLGPRSSGARGAEVSVSRDLEPEFGDGATIIADLEAGIGDVYVSRKWLPKRQREKACR
jgi:phage shock protein PspC (stress-responsive transcriptional regulator)